MRNEIRVNSQKSVVSSDVGKIRTIYRYYADKTRLHKTLYRYDSIRITRTLG